MALFPSRPRDNSDGQVAKRPDHPFRGRLRCGLGAAGRVQAHQFHILCLHCRSQPLLGQHQHPQRQTQQPHQPGDALLIAHKHRAQVQIARFEAAEATLKHWLLMICCHQSRYLIVLNSRIADQDLPAQPLQHCLPGGQIDPDRAYHPRRAAIAHRERRERRLHHPFQLNLRNACGHHPFQFGLVPIALATLCSAAGPA